MAEALDIVVMGLGYLSLATLCVVLVGAIVLGLTPSRRPTPNSSRVSSSSTVGAPKEYLHPLHHDTTVVEAESALAAWQALTERVA